MLQKASKVDSCPERDKCTILLFDEMYIREDLVYNEDVLFFWSMLSSNWDEESSDTLFQMVVNLWLTVHSWLFIHMQVLG